MQARSRGLPPDTPLAIYLMAMIEENVLLMCNGYPRTTHLGQSRNMQQVPMEVADTA
jgi:hypothetical protein